MESIKKRFARSLDLLHIHFSLLIMSLEKPKLEKKMSRTYILPPSPGWLSPLRPRNLHVVEHIVAG